MGHENKRLNDIMQLVEKLENDELKELSIRILQAIEKVSHKKNPAETICKDDNNIKCGHCSSDKTRPYGSHRGRKRYRCRSCNRTFNKLTNSPIAGTYHPEKWHGFLGCMVEGLSLRDTAEKVEISVRTAFRWRHKLLQKYEKEADMRLSGIVEADETFFLFSEKGKKNISNYRKPRKRGGKAQKRGVSNEQVPVIVGCDRNGNIILGVAGRGRITMADVENTLNNYIGSEVTLCTDAHSSFKSYAKSYKLSYVGLNISKGRRIVKKKYHIQNVNNFHSRLKQWMTRFHGVSTKYLQNYMNWFSLLEETKSLQESQSKAFLRRSVPELNE